MRSRGRAILFALALTVGAAPASGQEFQPPPRDPMAPPAGFGPEEAPVTAPGAGPGEAPPANAVVRQPDFVG